MRFLKNIVLVNFAIVVCYSASRFPCPTPCDCRDLGVVYCNGTGLTEIPRGLPFDTLTLDMAYNKIHSIPNYALEGLNDLEYIDLSGNQLTEGGIQDGALDTPSLTNIDLSLNMYNSIPQHLPRQMIALSMLQNKIGSITKDSFINYTSLSYLYLTNNKIRKIEERSFDLLYDLDVLDLSYNLLNNSDIPVYLFVANVKMTILSMRYNKLENVLEYLPTSLQHLDYVGNKIKTIFAYAFKRLKSLQTLELWGCQVTTLSDNAFYGLAHVTSLNIMQNNITSSITNTIFSGLTDLDTLYMSSNFFSKIEPMAFKDLKNMTTLWLNDNRLETLQPEVLSTSYMPRLSQLYIESNPWYCDCNLRWLRESIDNATYIVEDPHLIKCRGPPKLADKSWDVLKPDDFVCL